MILLHSEIYTVHSRLKFQYNFEYLYEYLHVYVCICACVRVLCMRAFGCICTHMNVLFCAYACFYSLCKRVRVCSCSCSRLFLRLNLLFKRKHKDTCRLIHEHMRVPRVHMYSRIRTSTHKIIHLRMCIHVHSNTQTCVHAPHTYLHSYIHSCTPAHACTGICAHVCICV